MIDSHGRSRIRVRHKVSCEVSLLPFAPPHLRPIVGTMASLQTARLFFVLGIIVLMTFWMLTLTKATSKGNLSPHRNEQVMLAEPALVKPAYQQSESVFFSLTPSSPATWSGGPGKVGLLWCICRCFSLAVAAHSLCGLCQSRLSEVFVSPDYLTSDAEKCHLLEASPDVLSDTLPTLLRLEKDLPLLYCK